MRNQVLTICALVIALFSANAEAKETKMMRGDMGIYDVVNRACNSVWWTSEAMRLTPLDPYGLKHLKVGDRVVVPDGCRHGRPSEEIRQATSRLFRHEAVIFAPAQPPQESSGSVLQTLINERDAALRRVKTLEKDMGKLVTDFGEMKAQLDLLLKKRGPGPSWWLVAGAFVVSSVLTFGMLWALVLRKLRAVNAALEEVARDLNAENSELKLRLEDPSVSFMHGGRMVKFEVRAKCPNCNENNLKPANCPAHAEKCFPPVTPNRPSRVREIPASLAASYIAR